MTDRDTELLGVQEVADLLGVSRSWVLKLCAKGRLRVGLVTPYGRLIEPSSVDEELARREKEGQEEGNEDA